MGSIFEGYQIYGTSNDDLHLGLGYINYDRESDVDLSELIIEFNRINGPSTGGSYRIVEGGNVWSFTIFIAVKANSPWTNVKFTWTVNSNDGGGISVRDGFTVLDGLPHPDLGIDYGTTIIAGEQYNWASFPRTIRGYADFSRSDNVEDFGKNSAGFGVPWYDKTKEPLNNLNGVDALNYIVTHNLEPDNQDMLDGDYGPTVWTVYCYNISDTKGGNTAYRIVWKNDYIESSQILPDVAKVQLTFYNPIGTKELKTVDLQYSNGYYTFNILEAFGIDYLEDLLHDAQYYVAMQILNENGESPKNRSASYYCLTQRPAHVGEDTTGGDVIKFILDDTGEDDKGYIDRSDNLDPNNPDTSFGTGYTDLYNIYATTDSQLTALGQDVWEQPFYEGILKISSYPLDSLIGVYRTPFAIEGSLTKTKIKIGNYESNVDSSICTDSMIRHVATFQMENYYNNFLDLEPFTSIWLYLPLYGITEINPSIILEPTDLYYVFSPLDAKCIITLRRNNNVLMEWECLIGESIELSSTNRGQLSFAMAENVVGNLGGIAGAIEGKDIIAGASSAGNLLSSASNMYESVRKGGTINSACEIRNGLNAVIVYKRPWYQEPRNYAHTHGKPCNLTKTISTLQGYTKCASNVDLSGIPCTESQRQMIFERLTSGFYI